MNKELSRPITRKPETLRPVKLSKNELKMSRAGTLGRFPSPDLYEPEDFRDSSARRVPMKKIKR